MGPPYVIVWDLDGTLGEFEVLEKHPHSTEPVRVQVRAGLAEALRTLSAAGFLHTILTVGTQRYAQMILQGTGLAEHFTRVEGRGDRYKGDAAGIGDALGLAEGDRPHRMLFVGDRLTFDEPQDRRVVFHLEICALLRPAAELARLVLHLRDQGGGSLRGGFDRLGSERSGWRRFWPWSAGQMPLGTPVRRGLPGSADLLLLNRADGCPIIGFEKPPEPACPAADHVLVPAELQARLDS